MHRREKGDTAKKEEDTTYVSKGWVPLVGGRGRSPQRRGGSDNPRNPEAQSSTIRKRTRALKESGGRKTDKRY